MPDRGHLVISAGASRLAIPLECVEALLPWGNMRELPLSAAWVEGVLPGEGQAVPVLRTSSIWGVGDASPEVLVVLSLGGERMAIPGSAPRLVEPEALEPPPENPEGVWSGCFKEGGGTSVPCLDVEKLYLRLGLH